MHKLVIAAGIAFAASLVHAQPTPPAPTGLVVGSGMFYSPIVANLDEAVRFYRDGLGFEFQGEPSNADSNPQLRAMFGLPDARLRWQIGRAPGIPGGVEIVEISGAGGERLNRRIQEPGTVVLIVVVRDADATLARLEALGAPVVTRGGKPVTLTPTNLRSVAVQDPDGHFVLLLQPLNIPATAPGTGHILNVRVRHTVADLDAALALYRDALLGGRSTIEVTPPYTTSRPVTEVLALPRGTQWRYSTLTVPTSRLPIELIEFQGNHRPRPFNIADPGATRIQLRVADIDAAAAALVDAGGTFISTGGRPVDLPAGEGTVEVGIVRDPDGLFVVLIDSPPAQ
jgi:catechol 2,3-dioxygenase-like lactoylglutathione lyase family enzyme